MRITRLLETARSFGADRRGNFAVVFGAAASVLALGAGFAVNTAQLYMTKSNLSQAVDAAVTSTARDLTTGLITEDEARKMITAFLSVNGETGFADAGTLSLDSVTLDKAANTVSAAASVDVTLAFPLFSTGPVQRIAASSTALYSDKKIEVAMMLDITGSMAGQKIRDLQTASKNAVTNLLGHQDPAKSRVRIAIVPYADAVNAGPLVRYVHYEQGGATGEPPAYNPVQLASAGGDPDMIIPGSGGTRADRCATERKGAYQFSDASPLAAMVNRDYRLDTCPKAELLPLTADRKTLEKTIDSFKANGYTAGHIGVQWTRYMLSPEWADVMPAGSAPRAYGAKKSSKYAILMTDGEFNTAFADVRASANVHAQGAKARSSAERHCDAMKKDGIEIFAVGFMLKEAAARQVLKACASDDVSAIVHYYEAADGAALDAAFRSIAANIERLAIIK